MAGNFTLRGIRSPIARKNLAAMRIDDPVLFYRSQKNQAVMGTMKVSREAYSDPTSADTGWLTCDFTPMKTLSTPVSLLELREQEQLSGLQLLRQPRVAVTPVSRKEFEFIVDLGFRTP